MIEILNGSILIRDNEKLCHVDQINWNDLISGNMTYDVGDNQDRSNCNYPYKNYKNKL